MVNSSSLRTTLKMQMAALLLAGVAFSQAHAEVEIGSFSASQNDKVVAANNDGGRGYSLRNANITVGDLQHMQDVMKANANELASLKKITDEQARVIEELKRSIKSSDSGNSSSDKEVSGLKRKVDEQSRSINQLEGQVSDLKRSSGSSSNSNSSEISSLKRDISNQERELNNVKRDLGDLSRKVK